MSAFINNNIIINYYAIYYWKKIVMLGWPGEAPKTMETSKQEIFIHSITCIGHANKYTVMQEHMSR